MFQRNHALLKPLLFAMLVVLCANAGAIAQDTAWRVGKLSGDVTITTSNGKQVALTGETLLDAGDTVRTGQSGRVLLVRGKQNMLISPNSVVGIPTGQKDGLSTTIIQQLGSVVFEAEKRNVKHFEVDTPYLAAVVKGTQFRVTVNDNGAQVDVLKGQVEVADFKSGKFALVQPDQAARVSAQGSSGLSLSGSGVLSPIQQGVPRSSLVSPIALPQQGPAAPGGGQQSLVASQTERGTTAPSSGHASDATMRAGAAASSSSSSAWNSKDGLWASTLSKISGQSSGKRNNSEDLTFTIIVACSMGIAVSLMVGAQRAWRRRRQKTT